MSATEALVLVAKGHPGSLTALVDELEQRAGALAEAGDLDTLAIGLAELRAILDRLRTLSRSVEDMVVELMPAKVHDVDGLGRLERRKGTDRKAWDWPALLPTLIRLSLDPDGTGEMPDGPEVMERMKALIVDVIGVTPSRGPRVTPLKQSFGLDPDEYAETTPARPTVQITGSVDL